MTIELPKCWICGSPLDASRNCPDNDCPGHEQHRPAAEQLIEREYIRAVKMRDGAAEPERRNFHQGAIEVLEQMMHEIKPGWAWGICRAQGWVPDRPYEDVFHVSPEGGEEDGIRS